MFDGLCHLREGYGAAQAAALEVYGTVSILGRGEMIPNRIRMRDHPDVVISGHSVLRVHFKFTDYELRQAQTCSKLSAQLSSGGGEYALKRRSRQYPFWHSRGGKIFTSRARMGADPKLPFWNGYVRATM